MVLKRLRLVGYTLWYLTHVPWYHCFVEALCISSRSTRQHWGSISVIIRWLTRWSCTKSCVFSAKKPPRGGDSVKDCTLNFYHQQRSSWPLSNHRPIPLGTKLHGTVVEIYLLKWKINLKTGVIIGSLMCFWKCGIKVRQNVGWRCTNQSLRCDIDLNYTYALSWLSG